MLSIEDMPKISRRIDGPLLKRNRQQHHGKTFDFSTVQAFLLTVAQRSEMISETYVAKFEAVLPEKQRHHFLGILSWEV